MCTKFEPDRWIVKKVCKQNGGTNSDNNLDVINIIQLKFVLDPGITPENISKEFRETLYNV